MFKSLKAKLTRSNKQINNNLSLLFTGKKLDEEALEDFEDQLLLADFGAQTAIDFTENLRKSRFGKETTTDEAKAFLKDGVTHILQSAEEPLPFPDETGLTVFLVAGVNGAGKTTTIAKLAQTYIDRGFKVGVAAGDTFRAAAVEQLQVWAQRLKVACYTADHGADAAALCYDSINRAKKDGLNILFLDTAGRLHNQENLMAELSKVYKVIQKQDAAYPQHTFLILDGTVGQAAISQVELFQKAVPISGLIVTKLDGTPKAGILVHLYQKFQKPIYAIGVGEAAEDLQPFMAEDFADSLLG